MTRRAIAGILLIFAPAVLLLTFGLGRADSEAGRGETAVRPTLPANLPVINVGAHGVSPLLAEALHAGGTAPFLTAAGGQPEPFLTVRKQGPAYAAPGATVQYAITVANFEHITHTYQLSDTLPPALTLIPESAAGLQYDAGRRTLSWRGALAPGDLDYVIEPSPLVLPYMDLADFGAPNLCQDSSAPQEACPAAVTFNLGVSGTGVDLYGQRHTQLTVLANGLILVGDDPATVTAAGPPVWLPAADAPGLLLAGLWREVNINAGGRWHAAILRGWIEGYDVFYAQWHDVPHVRDANLTARHAVALILSGDQAAGAAQALTGHAFYLYDNVSHPQRLAARGYVIGVQDRLGTRGSTYAFAGARQPSQGFPPAAGETLWVRPALFGRQNAYRRTFTYQAVVHGQPPQVIANTAVVRSSAADPALAHAWSTHYLSLRFQTFLPLLLGEGNER